MQNSIWLYRLFDIAEEINLEKVEKILVQNKPTTRMRLARIKPKSMQFKNPPVTVELDGGKVDLPQGTFPTVIIAKIYDLGVVSITQRILLSPNMAYEDIKGLAIHLNNTEELEASFSNYLQLIRNSLSPALVKESYQAFMEDFTIYYFRDWQKDWDAVPLLLAEPEPVSPQMRKETLNNSYTYGLGDLTIITWDSALVYDINGSTDIPDLLEFAVSQLLELRYYDSLLSQEMEKMYDAIEAAETQFRRLNNYRRIMNQIMELVVDISEITERIQNSLKVTEDVFYARVYSGALTIFRTKEWMENIQHKISVIQRSYTMLSEEITTRRSMWLEVAIIFLFILEIVLNFTPLLHK